LIFEHIFAQCMNESSTIRIKVEFDTVDLSKVDSGALAPHTLATQSKDVQHSGDKITHFQRSRPSCTR